MTGGLVADRRDVLAMGAAGAMLPLIGEERAQAATRAAPHAIGRGMPFSERWHFQRGVVQGADQRGFDDAGWRPVDLPHDWSIEDVPGGHPPDQIGPFDRKAIGGIATGFTDGGEGWYRKHFRVDAYPADARIEVLFDGAYMDSEVWLNGHPLGDSVHGYIPFAFDLTPHLDRGGDNVIAVRVRNIGRNSRWYSGSGLYREVMLDVLPAVSRIARWGVGAWTRSLTAGRAEIDVTAAVELAQPGVQLVTRLLDPQGIVVAEAASPAIAETRQSLSVRAPKLWSLRSPALYTLETTLRHEDLTIDRMAQPFGIRIVSFDAQRGMTINGEATPLRGGCVHHDNGLLGACAFADADERRVRLLKARGFTTIRSSHNPASRTLRDACDRVGMLLIDEAFDAWHVGKNPDDFANHFRDRWEEVIRAMVLPARNSPSVVMWSIGNEIPDRATDEGVRWEWTLANAVRRIDPTRPVTAALNGVLGQEMVAAPGVARPGDRGRRDNASAIFIDVPGYNYRLDEVQREFATHPERVTYASETFPKNVFAYAELVRRHPSFLGECVWTAMDYLGEAGIGSAKRLKQGSPPFYLADWPWVGAWCGDIDLIGRQKPQSLARDVAWGLSALEITVQRPVAADEFEWVSPWGWSEELPSWTWVGHERQPLMVRLYTSGDRVELHLNGAPVGTKTLGAADAMRAEIAVPYAPGTIQAIAYRGQTIVGRRRLTTVGAAARVLAKAEHAQLRAGRQTLAFVPIEVLDAAGQVLPDDERIVTIAIEGAAELAALGSANPLATGSLRATSTTTFRGRALAILRSSGKPGPVRLSVRSDGLLSSSAVVRFT